MTLSGITITDAPPSPAPPPLRCPPPPGAVVFGMTLSGIVITDPTSLAAIKETLKWIALAVGGGVGA
jgi:hypothetical protein